MNTALANTVMNLALDLLVSLRSFKALVTTGGKSLGKGKGWGEVVPVDAERPSSACLHI